MNLIEMIDDVPAPIFDLISLVRNARTSYMHGGAGNGLMRTVVDTTNGCVIEARVNNCVLVELAKNAGKETTLAYTPAKTGERYQPSIIVLSSVISVDVTSKDPINEMNNCVIDCKRVEVLVSDESGFVY